VAARRAIRINSRTGRLTGRWGAVASLLGSVDDAGQGLTDAVGGLVRVGLAGYLTGGGVWNPVLAGWTYAGDLLVWGALAVSFPNAIVTRNPGCELGALPWLLGGRAREAAPRPGCTVGLDRLDAWEAVRRRRRGRNGARPVVGGWR
jgi:hypothetical protein